MSEKKYDAFPGVVCQRLRNLVNVRTKAENHRKKLFDQRDQLEEEINAAEKKGKKADVQELKAKCFDVLREIDKDRKTIAWVNGEISEAVEKADDLKLWNTADVEVPSFEDDDDGEKDDPDQMVIGKPGTPKPVKGKRGEAVDENPQPEGFNQHLNASVNELEVNDRERQKLVDAGFVTIGQLHKFIEDKKSLRDKLNCGENPESNIKRALKAFLKKHTRADMQRERETAGRTH